MTSSLTICKKILSGDHNKDLLEDFAHLSSSDLHLDDLKSNRDQLVILWNSLQKTPGRCRNFTFSLVHDNDRIQSIITDSFSSIKYAWICHDQDTSVEHEHFHYVLMFPNAVSFSSIANQLFLPVTMLEKVYSKKGILSYLTHENSPNKHHYSLSDVTSNFDIEEEKKLDDGINVIEFYNDFVSVKFGDMSPQEFLSKYNMYCATLQVSGLMQVCDRLFSAYSTGTGLSSGAKCRVSYPSSSKNRSLPLQTVFSELSDSSIDFIDHGIKVKFDTPPVPKKSIGNYRRANPRSDLNDVE